ncbi:MAG TPA: hypothetical protein VFT59_04215, partial [Candidatus Saccharimonadales bacterium]|nr:hypothetical protein [Candidatus Saccharimonadales bacterium]
MDQNSNASPSTDKKTWTKRAVVAASIIAVAIIVVIILVLANQPKSQTEEASRTPAGPEEFTMTTEDRVVTYAGSPVYDACGLISFDTVRKTVNNYQTLLDMNGTDKKPSEPLTIEHNYIDRTISVPLGKDGQPHPTGATVGQEGVSSSSFVSDADANCWYGQGNDLSLGIGKTFAKVYVTQKPTPFSADFTAYLGTLQKVGSEGGIDVYVEPKTDTSGFFTSIITNVERGTAVIFKAASRELGEKGTVEISQTLSSAPKGPMNLTYPLGWSSMPNPCTLLTGEDFRRITERPASALAEDRLTLNEIGGRIMTRSCERLEVERLDNTPIAKTEVTVRVGNTEEATKKYVEDLKSGNLNEVKTEIVPLKQKVDGADDAYISIAMSSKGEAVG